MVTDGATCSGAEDAMMASEMPRYPAHNGSLDAALGLGWSRYGKKCHGNRGASKGLFHHLLPIEIAKTGNNPRLAGLVPA
jgi:hypothetical protein